MIKLRPGKSRMAFIACSFAIFSASLITSCQKEGINPIGVNSDLVDKAQSGKDPQSTKGGTTTGGTKGGTTTGGGTTGGTTTGGGTTGGTTGGGTTTGTNSSGGQNYTASGPIKAKSNTTYSNLLIDLGNSGSTGITMDGVTNVHITNCKIINSGSFAINVNNSSGVTIDNTLISNVGFGIYVQNSSLVKVNSNQFLNMNGINTTIFGHAIQFNAVNGGGNQINNNRIENIAGVALHPHDQISVYKSNGLKGDSIQIIGNWIRGGQATLWPNASSGACSIGIGDNGGSYQVVRNNIIVNPGFCAINAAGGDHIMVDHNLIYNKAWGVSVAGMFWANYSGMSSTDVTYAYNKVKFYNANGNEFDYNSNGNSNGSPIILVNNTWGASLDASILPATIITIK
jgi:hypothetical protein